MGNSLNENREEGLRLRVATEQRIPPACPELVGAASLACVLTKRYGSYQASQFNRFGVSFGRRAGKEDGNDSTPERMSQWMTRIPG